MQSMGTRQAVNAFAASSVGNWLIRATARSSGNESISKTICSQRGPRSCGKKNASRQIFRTSQ